MTKKQHLLAFVLGFGIPMGMFGFAVNSYVHRPKPQPTVTVAQKDAAVTAAKASNDATEKSLQRQLQDSNTKLSTTSKQLTNMIAQKESACSLVNKYHIKSTVCQ